MNEREFQTTRARAEKARLKHTEQERSLMDAERALIVYGFDRINGEWRPAPYYSHLVNKPLEPELPHAREEIRRLTREVERLYGKLRDANEELNEAIQINAELRARKP